MKSINIHFEGNSSAEGLVRDIVEILPYILFQNAIKYSPESSTIRCHFEENEDTLTVTVLNDGPILDKDEVERVTEKQWRGKNAQEKFDGSGKGLYLAKLICETNQIHLQINSFKKNGDIGIFEAKLAFPMSKKSQLVGLL